MSIVPSAFQEAIYHEYGHGSSNLFVNAGPGSAKTTTSVNATIYIPKGRSIGFFCFNKEIANVLKGKVTGGAVASTIHAHGYGALAKYARMHGIRFGSPDDWKYVNIAKQALESAGIEKKLIQKMSFELKKLTELALNTRTEYGQMAPPSAIEAMADKYNISTSDTILYSLVGPCVKAGIELWLKSGSYSFVDMVTLPVILDMEVKKYDEIIVDEGQDLNDSQLTLMFYSLSTGGRISMVADPFQSIMGFTGAMPDATDEYLRRSKAKTLPLSVCYRCPPNILSIPKHVCPTLTAFKTENGIIAAISQEDSFKMLRKGDFVLCRLCAPLVKQCLGLISRGISALIKGQDIGRDLIEFCEKAEQHRDEMDTAWSGFPNALRAESARILEKMTKERREVKMANMEDKVEALVSLYDFFSVTDINQFTAKIAALFVDKTFSATIVLCTVHKSKGLEAERIFILDGDEGRDYWPLRRKGQAAWELDQERNLIYVGSSRPKAEIYLITVPSKFDARLSFFLDGYYARMSAAQSEKKVRQPKTTAPQTSEPTVVNTDIIIEKRKEHLAKWKQRRHLVTEEDRAALLKPVTKYKQSLLEDND